MGKNEVNEFIKNSQKLLQGKYGERSVETILESYEKLSRTKGEDADMCRLSNSFYRQRDLIKFLNEDFYNESKLPGKIERNFDDYLSENRSPSKEDLDFFKKVIEALNSSLETDLKIIELVFSRS